MGEFFVVRKVRSELLGPILGLLDPILGLLFFEIGSPFTVPVCTATVHTDTSAGPGSANEGLSRGPGDIGSLTKEDVWESFLFFVGSVRGIEDITVELGKGLRALAGKTRELCGSSEAD